MVRISKPPEERRQELVEVATALFMENGYDKTSVRDILKEVGGAPGMFYYYFKSKDDIYQEVIRQYIDEYLSGLSDIYNNEEVPIPQRFEQAIKKVHDTFLTSVKINAHTDSPDIQGFFMSIKHKILNYNIEPITILLTEAVEKGFIKKENLPVKDIRDLALFIIYGIYGILECGKMNQLTVESADQKLSEIPGLVSKLIGITMDEA